MPDMPNAYMREILLRELRVHRVSADRYAAYLLVMTESNVPCPRCYAKGTHKALVIMEAADGTERGTCENCDASFIWAAA